MPTIASSYAHTGTPTVQVADARGLVIRSVQFHRRQANDPLDMRVNHQRFDAAGRLVASRDPYLFALAGTEQQVPENVTQHLSLSGAPLLTDSVDAGWRLALAGHTGQIVERWDGRGSHALTEFDALMRPVSVHERGRDIAEHTLERFTYAGIEADDIAHNLCGQLIRHDDPAGTLRTLDLGLSGALLKHTRQFLLRTAPPDWPALVAERDALLETGDGALTACQFSPTGELLQQIDSLKNRQAFAYSVAGELKNSRLTLAGEGQVEQLLVSDIRYNVAGQVEAETAGNGVITRHRYDPVDGRLTGLSAHKADGKPLQDLSYRYDAVGNVLSIEDAAQPIRYFNNQRIEPVKTYGYDTLYQLIEATGCEAKTAGGGPALPDLQPLPLDPGQIANYTQTYHYDAGGNLLDLVHVGAQAHGRILTRARYSNRCLPERDGRPPTEDELAAGFDANGNLRELQPGQSLTWDLRNQLQEVRPVVRKQAEDDREFYIYDGEGQRVRKVHLSLTNARTITREVRYLPGLEIRTHSGTGEILHVIIANAGSNSVQVLHWASNPPAEIDNDQVRYSLCDHLKSSTMELDQHADLISEEWYYPFGGTACWAARSEVEAKYKTVRYSGKERDATGLYYYGFRYYAPWLQRWINPDPAGYVDGMNLFSMVRNRPLNYGDPDGHEGKDLTQKQIDSFAGQIREGKEGLSEEDIDEVINNYLTKKSVDPKRYAETIKFLAGVETSAITYHRALSEDEKKGIHLFWSTNAGAKYINGITRNYTQETSSETTSLADARKAAYKELKNNLGSAGTIKMSAQTKEKNFIPALELFESHSEDTWRTILLVKASLGDVSKTEVFRGARLSNPFFEANDIVTTSGFTSFTPDEKTAETFTTKKYHDKSFLDETLPVVFIAKGTHSINGLTEVERLSPPGQRFKITKAIHSGSVSYVWMEKTSSRPASNIKWI
jgi:insecticidal toxin complex protein TccC